MSNSIQLNASLPSIENSKSWYARGKKVQMPITQTLAKGPGQFSKGVAPIYIQKGKGAHRKSPAIRLRNPPRRQRLSRLRP